MDAKHHATPLHHGHLGSLGQGHKLVCTDDIQMCLTQRSIQIVNTEPCVN